MYAFGHSSCSWTLPKASSIIPPSWREFVVKFVSFVSSFVLPVKGIKLITLKVACTLYSFGKCNWYGLLLIRLRSWKDPSLRGLSFDFLYWWNLCFLNCSQTQSASSKIISLFPLLLYLAYLSGCCCIWCLTFSCNFLSKLALETPSLLKKSCRWIRANKSNGVRRLNPYATSKGDNLVVLWIALL